MHGDLRTTSLEQLCRTLDAREATGELAIDGDGNQIKVWFRQGRIVRAAASRHELRLGDRLVHGGLMTAADLAAGLTAQSGTGRHLGEVLVDEGLVSRHVVRAFMQEQVLDALFAAVRWTAGTYTFEDDDVAGTAVPTDLTVAQLLFALETRHRVWDEITRTIPTIDRVPEFVPGADPAGSVFEPGERAIVDAIDGQRSVEQLAEELGFGPYEVAAVVHGLTVLGQVRLHQDVAPTANPAAAAATAISEAAAFLRGDGPAPTPLHEATAAPDPEPAAGTRVAEASPDEATTLDGDAMADVVSLHDLAAPATAPVDTEAPDLTVEASASEAAPTPPRLSPSGIDFAAELAGVMADLDVDGPRGGRPPADDVELSVLAPDPTEPARGPTPVVQEDPVADLPLPPPPGQAGGEEDALAAMAAAAASAAAAFAPDPEESDEEPDVALAPPAPTPAAAEEDDEETTFLIMDDDLSQVAPPPVDPMDYRPAPVPGQEDDDDSPEPWAFVISGGDDEDDEPERRARRVPTSPITAAVADVATGTPLPASVSTPEAEPAVEPEPEPEPEADLPAAPSRPRQTGEMSDLLRELRQLSDE